MTLQSMGYTPLFDLAVDPEVYKLLPFEKEFGVAVAPPARSPGARSSLSAV